MNLSRRDFLKASALGCAFCGDERLSFGRSFSTLGRVEEEKGVSNHRLFEDGEYRRIDSTERVFHISSSIDMFEAHGDLPEIWRDSGVTDVWLCTWFYGYFPYPWEKLDFWLERIKAASLRPHLICVPFCHGGGALDPRTEGFPAIPPEH